MHKWIPLYQTITWTNADILSIESLGTNFSEIDQNAIIFIKKRICIQENAFEYVACDMAAILSRPQCVKLNDAVKKLCYKVYNL